MKSVLCDVHGITQGSFSRNVNFFCLQRVKSDAQISFFYF